MTDTTPRPRRRKRRMFRHAAMGCAVLLLVAGVAATWAVYRVYAQFATPELPEKPADLPQGDYSFVEARARVLAEALVNRTGVGALSIALVENQHVVWAEGFGWQDKPAGVPATVDTLYGAGYLTRLLTAAGALRLAEAGRLDLDAPVEHYLPDFHIQSRFPEAPPLSARLMLSHHSGLPSGYVRGQLGKPRMPLEVLIKALSDEYLAAPPGLVCVTSDIGFSVCGYMLGAIAGSDYETVMHQEVLAPLGMTATTFDPFGNPLLADNYDDGERAEITLPRDIPNEGAYSTITDFVRFVRMVFAGGAIDGETFLRPESVAEMCRAQNADLPYDHGYEVALGWKRTAPDMAYLGDVVWHHSDTMQCRADIFLSLDHKVGLVALANDQVSSGSLRRLCMDALKWAVEAKTGLAPPPEPEKPGGMSPTPQEYLDTLPGYYSSPVGYFHVYRKDDFLQVKAQGHTADLVPGENGRFSLRYRVAGLIPINLSFLDPFGVTFYTVEDTRLAMFHEGPSVSIGAKTEPVPVPPAWRNRMGHYEVTNQNGDLIYAESVDLGMMDNFLMLTAVVFPFRDMAPRFILLPVSDTEAVTAGLGTRQGDTVFASQDGGTDTLRYSGYIFKRASE